MADEANRFRQLAAVQVLGSRNEHAEHVATFEAAIHGRADDAVRRLTEHYERTASAVAQQVQEHGQAA